MKRFFLGIAATLFLVAALPGSCLSGISTGPTPTPVSSVGVVMNGTPIGFDETSGAPFLDAAGRTQVPFRRTMEQFGCQIEWNQETQTATATKNATVVRVPIGKPYILVNDNEVPNDTAALIQNDRTYLPIRAVLESFDAYVSWDATKNSVSVDTSSPLLRVRFLDVGQGDSILIDMGTTEILIDGGDNKAGKTVVKEIKPYINDNLDYIIATHPDADHIGGLDNVLEAFTVGEVIDSGKTTDSATYRDYKKAAKSEAGCTLSLDENRVIPIGTDASLQIIETGDNLSTANDNSVIALLKYKDTTVLFTGDMSQTIERAQLALFSDVDVLKVGHHGSATSSCQEFLSVVNPEYAVLSYKPGNSYHHPSSATLHRLLARGTIAYGTGKSGTIVLSTNGTSYGFNKSNALVYADAGDAA